MGVIVTTQNGDLELSSVSSCILLPSQLARIYDIRTVRHTIPQEDEHQSETDSPYYQTLLRCTPKLVTALSGSPLSVADELLGKALISSEVYRSLLVSSLTPDNKAREMVVSVSSAVQLNSSKYVEFIQILQNDISLLSTGIIKTLHDTYSAIKAELQGE